jgi:hypothetical protein
MGAARVDILSQSLIFSGLNEDELSELAGLAIERSFAFGDFVFWDGDAPDWFYIVAERKVKVHREYRTTRLSCYLSLSSAHQQLPMPPCSI